MAHSDLYCRRLYESEPANEKIGWRSSTPVVIPASGQLDFGNLVYTARRESPVQISCSIPAGLAAGNVNGAVITASILKNGLPLVGALALPTFRFTGSPAVLSQFFHIAFFDIDETPTYDVPVTYTVYLINNSFVDMTVSPTATRAIITAEHIV